jgi:hypothetical protein
LMSAIPPKADTHAGIATCSLVLVQIFERNATRITPP